MQTEMMLKQIYKITKTDKINLEHILQLLNNPVKVGGLYLTCGKAIHFYSRFDYNEMYSLCDWQPHKLLHGQNEEVIEAIYNKCFSK